MVSKNILILISIVIIINNFVEKSNAVVSETSCFWYLTVAGFIYDTGIENRNLVMNNYIAFPAMNLAIRTMDMLFRTQVTRIQIQYYNYLTQTGIDPNFLQKPTVWCCMRYVEEVLIDIIHFNTSNEYNREIQQDVLTWQLLDQEYKNFTNRNVDEEVLTRHADRFQEIHNKYGEVVDKLLNLNKTFHAELQQRPTVRIGGGSSGIRDLVGLFGDLRQFDLIHNYWNHLTFENFNDLQPNIADWSLATVCALPTSLQPGDPSTSTRRTFGMN